MSLQEFQGTQRSGYRLWRMACVTIALSLLLGGQALAQASTVIGTVTYRNGAPAVHILVSIGQNYRYTDAGGRYKIGGVPAGRQHMICKQGSTVLWQGDVVIAGSQVVVNKKLP